MEILQKIFKKIWKKIWSIKKKFFISNFFRYSWNLFSFEIFFF